MALVLLGAATASAATSFSNSLKSFTGDSTLAATQGALLAAGFDFFSTTGLNDNGTPEDPADDFDPTIAFDANGARFGSLFPGDSGRNYMRTTQADFASTNFKAEITFVTPDLKNQDAFFGLGTGDTALFGWPDWSTQFSSVLVLPEITDGDASQLTTFVTADDVNAFANTAAPTLLNGTHRLRLAFDSTLKTATFSVDVNYAGGPFVADSTATPVDVTTLFGETGWLGEPSRLYFGGDDSVAFKDFSVTVGNADFNGDLVVDGRDFLVWQKGVGLATGATPAQGDADGDTDVDQADFSIWSAAFGSPAAVASGGAVPEPTSAALVCVGLAPLAVAARRKI